MYGVEAMMLTTGTRSRVEMADERVLRLISGITRREHLKRADIRKELDVKPLMEIIEKR